MRILRRHAGFTTNSSASSEWVWPPPEPPGAKKDQAQEGAEGGVARPTPPGETPNGEQSGPGTAATAQGSGETAPAPRPPERQSPLLENVLIIGGLCLAVLGVFALERAIRRWLRQRRSEDI
ncbi:MAG: hypothetical protein ACOCXJ_08275 [Planctomycetota bacterium]